MVAYTTATGLTLVANSSYVGTWDVPENANWSVVDSLIGGTATIALSGSNVTLTTAQAQCSTLIFTGALTTHVFVLFPTVTPSGTTITKTYTIINQCTNSTTWVVLLRNSPGGLRVCPPPGEPCEVINTGTNFYFKGLGPIGSFWDSSSVQFHPWITLSDVPPYLYCDGSAFSAATYPVLASLIGTTLPDARGRYRLNWNAGTGRTNVNSAINADIPLSGGGYQYALNGTFIPYMYNGINLADPSHAHSETSFAITANYPQALQGGGTYTFGPTGAATGGSLTGITVGTPGNVPLYMPPSYVGGVTWIRAG